MARAGSCLRAGQGRTKEWTSVHDRVMTQGCGQTDPALRVAFPLPRCGSARFDLPARQALRYAPPPDGIGKATLAMRGHYGCSHTVLASEHTNHHAYTEWTAY